MGQKEFGLLQCLKNPFSPSISSTASSIQLFPSLRKDTSVSFSNNKHPWPVLIFQAQLEISYLLYSLICFLEVRCFVACPAIFSPHQLLSTYKGLVSPRMEHASHEWESSSHYNFFDNVESKAFRLICSPALANCLQPLKSRRNVAFLSFLYRYFHAYFSSERATCMPPLLQWPRCTRLSTDGPSYTFQIPHARVTLYLYSFIPFTGQV